MAHTYVIQSVVHTGDDAIVTGTVDGIQVSSHFWFSALSALPSILAVQTFLGSVLLAALPGTQVSVPTWNGTITV